MAAKLLNQTAAGDQRAWSVLADAIENLSAALTLERVIEIVRIAARQVSGADGVTFVLRDRDRCHYVDENAIGPLWKGQKFPLSACISGWAMLNKRTAVVPDIYVDPRIPHDAYRPTFVKSLMMVPVRVEDPLAAIGAYWARRHEPDAWQIMLLESLARATAIALANIALTSSLRESAEKVAAQAAEIASAKDETQREAVRRLSAEEQLRQAQKMEIIGQLTGGLAHDFNNLLGVVVGNLDILIDERKDDPTTREMAGHALEAAQKGAELIRSLLAFARRQPLEPRRVDVDALIRKTAGLLRHLLGENIEIRLDLAERLWPVIADPAQLEASLANLATNARDAMPGGGRIHIQTANRSLDSDYVAEHPDAVPGDYTVIEVSDTGVGISHEAMSRIFEPFFTTKEAGRGTGLGLSMVFGFIKQSGGHINVYSEEGVGTTFRLYLPRAAVDASEADSGQVEIVPRGRDEMVLVVEDNADVRRVAVAQLLGLGYRVIEAVDVASAVDILEHKKVDLLLTDVVMRGRSGHELVRIAQERWPSVAIVVSSGFPEAALTGVAASPDVRHLSKPYRKLDLARAVREALDNPAA